MNILDKEIHIWHVNMVDFEPNCDHLLDILSKAEQAKALRFVQQKDRNCSIIARAVLRQLLSQYLACENLAIDFEYNDFGKPVLAGVHAGALHFNVSHSRNWIVYAFCRQCAVGVDIEYMSTEVDVSGIAERFFHPGENHFIQSLTGKAQMRAFFHCWTRKEALLKALGQGLSFPLAQCQVSLAEQQPVRVLSMAGHNINDWTLHNLVIANGFAAAVAIDGSVTHIQQRECKELCRC